MFSFFAINLTCCRGAYYASTQLLLLNYRLKALHMATIGDLLLLTTTSKDPSHRYTHAITLNLDSETHALLVAVASKINNYSEDKVTTASLARALVHFARESLTLDKLLDDQDPLCVLPTTHSVRGQIAELGSKADVVGLSPDVLTNIEDFKKGSVLWKP